MTTFIPGGPARYAHQKRGLQKLIETRGVGALLFDPGTGKTATAIDYMSLLALKSPTPEVRVLVVCPLVAVDTWVLQMKTWASPQVHWWAEVIGGTLVQRAVTLADRGGRPYRYVPGTRQEVRHGPRGSNRSWGYRRAWAWAASDPGVSPVDGPGALGSPRLVVEILNIDTFSQRGKVGSRTMADVMVDAVQRFGPELMVLDESHKIKSASSNVSRLMARLTPHVRRRVLLTGTVMPHSPLDVFGQWRFLDPMAFGEPQPDGSIRPSTYGGFRDRFAVLGGWMGREVKSFKDLDQMQSIMAKNAVVVRKKDALDLPRTSDVTVPVTLSAREKSAYRDMKDLLQVQLSRTEQASSDNRLTQMLRLRQITAGMLPDDSGVLHTIGTSKVDTIASLVHDTLAGERRIVVFGLFRAEIALLADRLARTGTTVRLISGDTPKAERVRVREEFGSKVPGRIVLVAQIKTMSLAVNELVTANHAIFASLSQQRDDYIQARDRLDRIGQTRPVTFWHVNAPGTVDDVILTSHQNRTSLEDAVLRHIQGEETR